MRSCNWQDVYFTCEDQEHLAADAEKFQNNHDETDIMRRSQPTPQKPCTLT